MAMTTRKPAWMTGKQSSFQPGDRITTSDGKTYILGSLLGSGGQATVFDVGRKALKIYDKDRPPEHWLSIMELLTKNEELKKVVVPIYEYGVTSDGLCFKLMGRYSRNLDGEKLGVVDAKRYLARINQMLHTLHHAGLVHGDIKPSSLCMIDGELRFCDFGTAHLMTLGDEKVSGKMYATFTARRTIGYTAPEILIGGSSEMGAIYSDKVDYYSLAPTLASLMKGRDIFSGLDGNALTQAFHAQCVPGPQTELTPALNWMYRFSPSERWGYSDISEWLRNPHYRKNGIVSHSVSTEKTVVKTALVEETWDRPLFLGEKSITSSLKLARAVAETWDITVIPKVVAFLETQKSRFASAVKAAGTGDVGLAKITVALSGGQILGYKGRTYDSINAVVSEDEQIVLELLKHGLLSYWMEIRGEAKQRMEYQKIEDFAIHGLPAVYGLKYALKKQLILQMDGFKLNSVDDIAKMLVALMPLRFYGLMNKLASHPKLVGMIAARCGSDQTNQILQEKSGFERAVKLVCILDKSVHDNDLRIELRKYSWKWILGDMITFKNLLKSKYYDFDSHEDIVSRVSAIELVDRRPIEEQYESYRLIKNIYHEFRIHLLNDEQLVTLGIYDGKTIFPTHTEALLLKAPNTIFDEIPAKFLHEIQAANNEGR